MHFQVLRRLLSAEQVVGRDFSFRRNFFLSWNLNALPRLLVEQAVIAAAQAAAFHRS